MQKKEIAKMKKDMEVFAKNKIDLKEEEEALYQMSKGLGWGILINKANKKCCELLEPLDEGVIEKSANHVLLLANELAKSKTLRVFREFINEVESIRKVRDEAIRREVKGREVSEKKA